MDERDRVRMRSLARRVNEQLVLEVIFGHGPVSRVEVAERTGLSKPTVSSIVGELEKRGLVRAGGQSEGGVGRTAQLYHVDGAVGHVVGFDLGGTKLRAAVADIYGEILVERAEPTDPDGADAVIAQMRRLTDELPREAGVERSSVHVVAVGTPGTVDPVTGDISLATNIPRLDHVRLAERLDAELGVSVVVENDVNVAAVGERWQGLARNCDNFAFLAVGTGTGMGLILDGELWRGKGGAAGEVGFLPLGRDPFDEAQRRGPFEEAVAGSGVVARMRAELEAGAGSVLTPESTAADVFVAAAGRDELAGRLVDEEARLVALAIAAIAAVVAPEMVVLGGGIGANPLLVPRARAYVDDLLAQPLQVETSALGHRASLIGTLAVGLEQLRALMFPAPGLPRPRALEGDGGAPGDGERREG